MHCSYEKMEVEFTGEVNMISEDERIRVETLKVHITLDRLGTVRTKLIKKAQEHQNKADELIKQADLLIEGTDNIWHIAHTRAKGNEKKNFWGWLFKDKNWEKHQDLYNFRTLKPLTKRQKEILVMEQEK